MRSDVITYIIRALSLNDNRVMRAQGLSVNRLGEPEEPVSVVRTAD